MRYQGCVARALLFELVLAVGRAAVRLDSISARHGCGRCHWMRAMSRPSGDAEMLPVLDIREYLSLERNDVPSIMGYAIERCMVVAISFLEGLRVCLGGSLHKNGVGSTCSSQRKGGV